MKETIFDPLGMNNTGVDYTSQNRAIGKTIEKGSFVNAPQVHKSHPLGAGCLKSTIKDMLKWQVLLDQLCQRRSGFISPVLANQMFTPPKGISSHYGFGLDGLDQHTRSFEHGGAIHGGSTFFSLKNGEGVIILSSQDQFPVVLLEKQARSICFKQEVDDPIEFTLRTSEILLKQHNVTEALLLIRETIRNHKFKDEDARNKFIDIVGKQYYQTI